MERQDKNRIRKYLWHWGRCDKIIQSLTVQMRFVADRMNDLYVVGHSPSLDGMPRSTATSDPVIREFERIEEARKNFQTEMDACEHELLETQRFKAAMNDIIKSLSGLEQDIIRMRYKDGHTWIYVAAKCGISEKTAYNREERALEVLDRMIVQGAVTL